MDEFDDEFSVGKSELLDRPVVGLPVYQIELGFSPFMDSALRRVV
jgi:hypothetical protein